MTGVAQALGAAAERMRSALTSPPEQVADGVWIVRGGLGMKIMNVYLIRDGHGVLAFDAGIRPMRRGIMVAAEALGGLTRIVLGHAHFDHRGAAPGLGVPVLCHPLEVADAEGDGGAHRLHWGDFDRRTRAIMKLTVRLGDGGPVSVSETVSEGDEIAGFKVVHLPGHTPGMIALWRESDRLAIVSDCFYTMDTQTGKKCPPRVPHCSFNHDTDGARAAMRKLAEMQPAAAWPGHADPILGDVAAELERAASA